MNSIVFQLMALLESETHLYQALLGLILEERNAIIDSDLEKFDAVGQKRENLYQKLRMSEDQRMRILTQLSRITGCPSSELTLSRLSRRLPLSYADRLNECRRNLSRLLEKIQKATRHNRGLINHSLALIRGSVYLFGDLLAAKPLYHRNGDIKKSNRTGALLRNDA